MSDHQQDDALDDVQAGRRAFVKRMAVGAAFTVPVVSSFSMSGLSHRIEQAQASNLSPGFGSNSTT